MIQLTVQAGVPLPPRPAPQTVTLVTAAIAPQVKVGPRKRPSPVVKALRAMNVGECLTIDAGLFRNNTVRSEACRRGIKVSVRSSPGVVRIWRTA